MVYFIKPVASRGPVKIGFSRDPEDRAKRLGRQLKMQLCAEAIIPGGIAVEQVLHERFAGGRLHGEWFDPDTPGLFDFTSAALLFEGFWPTDKESPGIIEVLEVLEEGGYAAPDCCYTDGWA